MATATAITEEAMGPQVRREGVITSWRSGNGWGWVASGYEKFFLHYSFAAFPESLIKEGLKVTFEPNYEAAPNPEATKVALK